MKNKIIISNIYIMSNADTTPGKVKLHNSLKVQVRELNVSQEIIDDIKAQFRAASLENYKYNNQLVLDICNYVENNVKKRKTAGKQYCKKDIVLKVVLELFPDVDLNIVDETIETFFENGLIKKDYTVVRVLNYVLHFLGIVLRR